MFIKKLFILYPLFYYCFGSPSQALPKKHPNIKAIEKILKNVLTKMKLSQDKGPFDRRSVQSASLTNFDDLVTYNGKDTLVEFYAPWCAHCKKFAPVYHELGEKLKDEDVAIIQMDGTGQVPSKYDVAVFPTLYWVPKDAKLNPIPYRGGQEVDDIIRFIAEHASSELKGYDRQGNPK